MILRIVRAQRPHWALQPRQPETWAVVRGADVAQAVRTAWSLMTLQEQTIIEVPTPLCICKSQYDAVATGSFAPSQRKTQFKKCLIY